MAGEPAGRAPIAFPEEVAARRHTCAVVDARVVVVDDDSVTNRSVAPRVEHL